MTSRLQRCAFLLFFLSGFSGLVDQIVWLRLAFASFGVLTSVISLVISTFMLGLGLGSWFSGSLLRRYSDWKPAAALRAYAATEFLIGAGALVVPWFFQAGATMLLPAGDTDSATYLFCSALLITASMVPFCLCMGATYPLMMQALRHSQNFSGSFSWLYLANVLGALAGTVLTPFVLVELFGFRGTLLFAVAANWIASMISLWLSFFPQQAQNSPAGSLSPAVPPRPAPSTPLVLPRAFIWTTLFLTGLTSMALEVIWTRWFTPALQTQVYSFASLLFTYLLATWLGSAIYRWHRQRGRELSSPLLLALLALAAFVQIFAADPRVIYRLNLPYSVAVLLSIFPYCAILGYLTPKLIDQDAQGDPTFAGHAYALNILGCIVGPLIASYLLLPRAGDHWASLPLACLIWFLALFALLTTRLRRRERWICGGLLTAAACCSVWNVLIGKSFEDYLARPDTVILRDQTATVLASPGTAQNSPFLTVNGVGMTILTPLTKLMAHLPLAHLEQPPKSALVICFGMGTTFRSMLSWEIPTTAVELVPSVVEAFPVFFANAAELIHSPLSEIVIDDGRRFLHRTTQRFDVIAIDPPPPISAAGSSLLYSREFYELINLRLTEQGILQQWFPTGDVATYRAVLRTLCDAFPYVRVMPGFQGSGCHMLASRQPIPDRSAARLVERMPAPALQDLVEFTPNLSAQALFQAVLDREVSADSLLNPQDQSIVTDDHPYNEYYLLRSLRQRWNGTHQAIW